MISLIKKYFLLIGWFSYLLIASMMAFLYIGTIPPYFIFFMFFVAFIVTPFYYDHKHSINYFIVSLPVSKMRIVYSHFLYAFIVAIFMIIYQYLLMIMAKYLFDGPHYIYDSKDMIILFCLTLIISSVLILVYYMFRSFILASIVLLAGLFISTLILLDFLVEVLNMNDEIIFNDIDPGFSLLVEKYMPISPYISLIIISVIILLICVKVSEKILHAKDI